MYLCVCFFANAQNSANRDNTPDRDKQGQTSKRRRSGWAARKPVAKDSETEKGLIWLWRILQARQKLDHDVWSK